MKTNNNLDDFSDIRVVNLLTPHFTPPTSLSFKAPAPRRRPLWQAVRISAVAAMVAVVVVIGITGVQTSTAREVVERAMTQLLESDNCLVQFTANVAESKNSGELYDIDFEGTQMRGTVEIRKEDSKVKVAIKWQDKARSMELYDGKSYRRYQNGQLVLAETHDVTRHRPQLILTHILRNGGCHHRRYILATLHAATHLRR